MSVTGRLANRHFLVVDDEEFVRTLIVRFLTQAGAAAVVEAADGAQAIAAIRSYDMTFDAVISDVNMRPMNGLELLSAIRTGAGGLKRNASVLMLTAHAQAERVAEALALDADAFVVKPVGREALIDRVVRVLERSVPIQTAAQYATVGVRGNAPAASPAAGDAAPPAKPLIVSTPTLPSRTPTRNGASSHAPPAETASVASNAVVQRVPLDRVKAHSILAQDIHFGDAQEVLVAASTILTKALLDRLKDLRHVHDSFSHLFVVEPARS